MAYDYGTLSRRTREIAELVASLLLRCDNCIAYHVIRCRELGLSREEMFEVYTVALAVGSSIVIPHLRRTAALQEASKAAESWRASGEELRALLPDVRALLAGVDSKQITETVQHVRDSTKSLRLAIAKLPSTTTSLSTTIWLLNGLPAIGITLGVLRIVWHRTTKQ